MVRLIAKVKTLVDKAEAYIKTGKVFVNGQKIEDPNYQLRPQDDVRIKQPQKYVSRAAYKLLAALKTFQINLQGAFVLDIGASTGGFTQVALEHGASKVYALDVGTNQLDYKLRTNKRVVVLEKTNLKTINLAMFKEQIEFVLVDVSFISVRRVFDVLSPFQKLQVLALIKPQFEAFRDQVDSGGFVSKEIAHQVLAKIKKYAFARGFQLVAIIPAPLKGAKAKNQEYISLFTKE